jgi:lipoprotein-anchoring transpeptidase ErfK/SrfK
VSGFRRTVPYLAAGSIVLAAGLTAALASGAAATPGGGTAESAAEASASAQAAQASAAARAAASASASAASASASAAAVASASASAAASAKAAAAASAAASAAAAARAKLNTVAGKNEALRAEGVPCDEHATACVSLSKQEAWLLRDGKVVYGPVHVATGRAALPTPTGDFHVWYKIVDGWSTTYDAPMPYSVFFYEGDAFHEDPITVRSHGCVHLSLKNAEYFYRFLHYGDLVEVRD